MEDLPAGVFIVKEEFVPEPFVRTASEQTIALRPGKISEARFEDYTRPGLEIVKRNIADGSPIEGVTYQVRQVDGDFLDTVETNTDGRAFLEVDPGSYEVSEVHVPSNVIISEIPQTISLEPGVTRTVRFFNAVKPSLTIQKRNSITKDPLETPSFISIMPATTPPLAKSMTWGRTTRTIRAASFSPMSIGLVQGR